MIHSKLKIRLKTLNDSHYSMASWWRKRTGCQRVLSQLVLHPVHPLLTRWVYSVLVSHTKPQTHLQLVITILIWDSRASASPLISRVTIMPLLQVRLLHSMILICLLYFSLLSYLGCSRCSWKGFQVKECGTIAIGLNSATWFNIAVTSWNPSVD